MGLTITRAKTVPNILDALREFAAKPKKDKRVLMLCHAETGVSYRVDAFDPATGRARLHIPHKKRPLTPIITEREAKLYFPLWR